MGKRFRRSLSTFCLQDFFFLSQSSFSIMEDKCKNDDCSVWIALRVYCAYVLAFIQKRQRKGVNETADECACMRVGGLVKRERMAMKVPRCWWK